MVSAYHAELVRVGDTECDPRPGGPIRGAKKGGTKLIPLTVPEVRQLLLRLVWEQLTPAEQTLTWSSWRRAHLYRARKCHYRARGAKPPK